MARGAYRSSRDLLEWSGVVGRRGVCGVRLWSGRDAGLGWLSGVEWLSGVVLLKVEVKVVVLA